MAARVQFRGQVPFPERCCPHCSMTSARALSRYASVLSRAIG